MNRKKLVIISNVYKLCGNNAYCFKTDLFEEELRKWKLQEDEIIKLKCTLSTNKLCVCFILGIGNGFRNVGDLLSVPDIDKLEFLNMLEKRRIQLIINSLIEKKTEGMYIVMRIIMCIILIPHNNYVICMTASIINTNSYIMSL